MIFFLTAEKFSLDWWGRFRPQGRMEGREKKEKKGGDEGLNGFKLPFPLGSSYGRLPPYFVFLVPVLRDRQPPYQFRLNLIILYSAWSK